MSVIEDCSVIHLWNHDHDLDIFVPDDYEWMYDDEQFAKICLCNITGERLMIPLSKIAGYFSIDERQNKRALRRSDKSTKYSNISHGKRYMCECAIVPAVLCLGANGDIKLYTMIKLPGYVRIGKRYLKRQERRHEIDHLHHGIWREEDEDAIDIFNLNDLFTSYENIVPEPIEELWIDVNFV
ncbi:uncharacterized protein LOC112588739 [Harpegnathos saltator]|uniref:uncharacterized protein LOC112588739 n=1 Tax=Harpegnathos saltator TaxID=610380 RepID=UPI000DBEDBD3|nr:uncharacterized protein LOC112588739 [Harpegnathos saltator]